MSLASKYEKSLTEKWCMRLRTRHPDGDDFDGIVTHVKSDFIAFREEKDLELDGVVVLSKRFIKSVRDGRYDKAGNEILRHNSALKRLRPVRWLDACDSLRQVLAVMKRRDIWPAVEIVFDDGTNSAFYLGPLTELAEDWFRLHCYDAAGVWEKEYKLSYAEVFKVEFNSKYCSHFNSYMKAKGGARQ